MDMRDNEPLPTFAITRQEYTPRSIIDPIMLGNQLTIITERINRMQQDMLDLLAFVEFSRANPEYSFDDWIKIERAKAQFARATGGK